MICLLFKIGIEYSFNKIYSYKFLSIYNYSNIGLKQYN